MNIIVTGGDGQLAKCIKSVCGDISSDNSYFFLSKEDFNLTDKKQMKVVFEKIKPEIVINCAAYTNVEGAEDNPTIASDINFTGVRNMVRLCKKYGSYLIHISTDYVFDGKKNKPYKEIMPTKEPLNVYGSSKLKGDQSVLSYKKGIVLRTSWLYSEYGHNFYKTMLERIDKGMETNVIHDQIGTPTYAKDLANFIVKNLISDEKYKETRGLYNFSNNGMASWYDFASMIENLYSIFKPYIPEIEGKRLKHYILPTTTKEYKTKAKRPSYSVLDKTKIESEFEIKIPHWAYSLLECMKNDGNIKKGW